MVSIPNISMANPSIMLPMFFFLSFLVNIINIIPMMARTGENDEGLSNCKKKLSPSMAVRLKSQAVIVVPILAPIMIPMA